MDHDICESCYKGTMIKRNYMKLPFHGHFPIIFFVEIQDEKKNLEPQHVSVIYRTKVKMLHYNYLYFRRKYWTKSLY